MKYVVFYKPTSREVSEELRQTHLSYLKELCKAKKIINAGPLFATPLERIGAIVLYNEVSKEDVIKHTEGDPLVAGGCRNYQIYEWKISVGN